MYGPMNVVGWSSQASCGLETLRIGVRMELRTYCAYNQTRESFLGLEVAAGDLSYKSLSCEGALTLRPNEGLWLRPFRGIPDSGVTAPVDLIFLDKECRVIDMAESFPVNRSGAGGQDADTLLVLPSHSIFSSDTQKGDQFVLCVPEEMPRRLERLCDSGREAPPASGEIAMSARGAKAHTARQRQSWIAAKKRIVTLRRRTRTCQPPGKASSGHPETGFSGFCRRQRPSKSARPVNQPRTWPLITGTATVFLRPVTRSATLVRRASTFLPRIAGMKGRSF